MPLIAVLLLIGAGLYAMHANRSHNKVFDVEYWDYNGNPGGEDTASNYTLGIQGSPTHSSCGLASTTICQIKAEPDPANPAQPNLNGQNPLDDETAFDVTKRGTN